MKILCSIKRITCPCCNVSHILGVISFSVVATLFSFVCFCADAQVKANEDNMAESNDLREKVENFGGRANTAQVSAEESK